jgi:YtcA-like protein
LPSTAKWIPSRLTHIRGAVTAVCLAICLICIASPAFSSDKSILSGAPSFSLFGAFFPGWMFCGLIGVIFAILARVAMISSGLAKILPFQLFVCASIGLIIGLLVWLVWFGQ